MDDKEVIRDLLADLIKKDLLFVVEGKKDKASLEALGVKKIVALSKPLFAMVELVASMAKEVVLLTDLDSEGRKLYHELFVHLQRHGVKVDNRLREVLFRTPIRHIEGLRSFLER